MAESQNWQDRLKEARARMAFEPTPSGATPYVATLERVADVLDAVEVTGTASTAGGPAETLAKAVALLLREHINQRMRETLLRSRFETQPDRVDELLDRVNTLLDAAEARGKRG